MGVRACQNCHGNGQVQEWDPKQKTYVYKTCRACGGSGKVDTRTI